MGSPLGVMWRCVILLVLGLGLPACDCGGTPAHLVVNLKTDLRAGLDDFARRALGSVEAVELPRTGRSVARGEPLFSVSRGRLTAHFAAPMSGKVVQVNEALASDPELLTRSPYGKGWVCLLQPSDLAGELASLRIGAPVVVENVMSCSSGVATPFEVRAAWY